VPIALSGWEKAWQRVALKKRLAPALGET